MNASYTKVGIGVVQENGKFMKNKKWTTAEMLWIIFYKQAYKCD